MYLTYKKYIKDDLFFRPYGVHGIGHANRVLRLSMILAAQLGLSDNNKKILAIAVCYYDIGRIHDFTDDEHGERSVREIERKDLFELHDLTDDEKLLIKELIRCHSVDDENWKILFKRK